jgi:hypothetical protein
MHTPNIHALCGIRTHDLSFRDRSATVTSTGNYIELRKTVNVINFVTIITFTGNYE